MTQASFFKLRIYVVVAVTIAIVSLLTWNYLHGGIPRHHILADENLPSFSNAWGALLIPLLTWFLTWRVQKRLFHGVDKAIEVNIQPVVYAFAFSLLYAIAMSTAFSLGYEEVIANMMLAIFVIALFIPVYQSQYLLGLVLGMTFTFGAVLPTGIGTILCAITAIIYLVIRRGVLLVWKRFSSNAPS